MHRITYVHTFHFSKILGLTSYSTRLEEILLALLKQQQCDREKVRFCNFQLQSRPITFQRVINLCKLNRELYAFGFLDGRLE